MDALQLPQRAITAGVQVGNHRLDLRPGAPPARRSPSPWRWPPHGSGGARTRADHRDGKPGDPGDRDQERQHTVYPTTRAHTIPGCAGCPKPQLKGYPHRSRIARVTIAVEPPPGTLVPTLICTSAHRPRTARFPAKRNLDAPSEWSPHNQFHATERCAEGPRRSLPTSRALRRLQRACNAGADRVF
jgi:hypothetical protein